MSEQTLMVLAPIFGAVGLLVAFWILGSILRRPQGTERMKDLSDQIHEGAMVFLKSWIIARTLITPINWIQTAMVSAMPVILTR